MYKTRKTRLERKREEDKEGRQLGITNSSSLEQKWRRRRERNE